MTDVEPRSAPRSAQLAWPQRHPPGVFSLPAAAQASEQYRFSPFITSWGAHLQPGWSQFMSFLPVARRGSGDLLRL